MRDMFGVGSDEAVGCAIADVDMGLPVGDIGPHLHGFEAGRDRPPHTMTLDAIDRKGQPFRCRVMIGTLADVSGPESAGTRFVIIVDPLDRLDP